MKPATSLNSSADNVAPNAGNAFFIAQDCHPQTIEVVRTRALPFGIEIVVGDPATFDPGKQKIFGALLQYPATDGAIRDPRPFIEKAHAGGSLVVEAEEDPVKVPALPKAKKARDYVRTHAGV